jgi:hypothetical protein
MTEIRKEEEKRRYKQHNPNGKENPVDHLCMKKKSDNAEGE